MIRFVIAVLAAMAAFGLVMRYSGHFLAAAGVGVLTLFCAARMGD